MGIGAVSSNSSYSYSPSGQNNEIKMLEKQKTLLQEEKKKINQSDMDPKLKQDTTSQLDDQIAEIESQIWEKKMEKLTPDTTKDSKSSTEAETARAKTETTAKGKKSGNSINSEHMLSAVAGYDELKTMSKVRTDLQGKLRLATSSGENPEAGAGIQAKIEKLEGDMGQKSNEIQADLKEAAEEVKNIETVEDPAKERQDANNKISDPKDISTPPSEMKDDKAVQAEDNDGSSDNAETSDNESMKAGLEVLPEGSYIDVKF